MIAVDLDGEATVLDDDWTMFGPQFDAPAWSQQQQDDEQLERLADFPEQHGWSRVMKIASAVTAVGIGAVTVALWFSPGGHTEPVPTPPPPAAAAPTTPFVMPDESPTVNQITPDGEYLHVMAEAGVRWTNPDRVIHDGHNMCDYLETNPTIPLADLVSQVAAKSPGLNIDQVRAVVISAIDVYCPQFKEQQ